MYSKSSLYAIFSDISLKYHPTAVALKLRCCIDNTHFSLADGFMVVFASNFPRSVVLNEFDASQRTIKWIPFMNCFTDLLKKHGHHQANNPTVIQLGSAFNSCDSNSLLSIHGVSTASLSDDQPKESTPEVSFFRGQPQISEKYEHCSLPGSVPIDKKLHSEFQVYISAFIWAFNAIFREDKKIRSLLESIVHDRAIVSDFRRTPLTADEEKEVEEVKTPLLPVSSIFNTGTGNKLRKDPNW